MQRLAAESLIAETEMTMEQAIGTLEFQDAAAEVMDELEMVLGEASGGIWFDVSRDGGRLKIGVPKSLEAARVEAARQVLRGSELLDRTDSLTWLGAIVIWRPGRIGRTDASELACR
jgi:hypothetical protein